MKINTEPFTHDQIVRGQFMRNQIMRRLKGFVPAALTAVALMSCSPSSESAPGVINPDNWPEAKSPFEEDPAIEKKIAKLLAKMSVEEKVGQIMQADINSVTPAEAKEYNLGSILNGGNSAPGKDNYSLPPAWLALADEYWNASTDTDGGRTAIPIMWGTDAVHGHSNIIGATIFPHNIGLGAANNPDLMEEIGKITAKEIRVTGIDWTFAPTIAVVRNDRWGRTYESYSEGPDIVASYAPRLVYGLQGRPGDDDFLKGEHVMATVKHFVGDGGTVDGKDQGDNVMSEAQLRDSQAAGYASAINAGVQSVMASFNSWHGKKLHGHKPLLTDVLRGRMGFDGLVVGDWNGHGQVKGCDATSCAQSVNAGLDLFMAPDSWKDLYANTLKQVEAGEISMERLDEAVARILRVKIRSGLFEAGLPSTRKLSGQWNLLGSVEHMAVARQAVRESMVLLKNQGVLPIKPGATILVGGDGANDIGKQSGGWTISWQGTGNSAKDFPKGVSIYDGIKAAAETAGGTAILMDESGDMPKADVAIIVYGEDPYAEFQGDRDHVDFVPTEALDMLTKAKASGMKTVSIFLSGRPMWVNPELNQSDAFVAAWLPGTAGNGIADVLVAGADGKAAYDFKGKLTFSWPKSSQDVELNYDDEDYDPLFAYGYGLSYAKGGEVETLPTDKELEGVSKLEIGQLLLAGVAQSPWSMHVYDERGLTVLPANSGGSLSGFVTVNSADDQTQEDMRLVKFTGKGSFVLETEAFDFERESNADMVVKFNYRIDEASGSKLAVGGRCGSAEGCGGELDLTDEFKSKIGQGWQTANIKLSCLSDVGVYMGWLTSPFALNSDGGFTIGVQNVELVTNTGEASCTL